MAGEGFLMKNIRANLRTYTLVLALLFFWLLFFSLTVHFDNEGLDLGYLSARNLSNLFRQMTVASFLSCGMVLVIVAGSIDLSVGKFAGFISVIVAVLQDDVWTKLIPGNVVMSAIFSVLIAIAFGILIGMLQGFIIAYLGVPSFIATLGFMNIFNGLILYVTGGKTIAANQPVFSFIGQGYLPILAGWGIALVVIVLLYLFMFMGRAKKVKYGIEVPKFTIDLIKTSLYSVFVVAFIAIVNQFEGMPFPVLLLAIFVVVISYISNNTRFGRYTYAIGGNKEAARLSGINIKKTLFSIFVLMGFLSAVSGIVLASYVGFGTTAAGQGYELDAIAACILGGTSTLGGEGTIMGAMVGSLIMTSLTNGLQFLDVKSAWQYVTKGTILILAVWADVALKKSSK
jgi:D-xylose transport system permease protein